MWYLIHKGFLYLKIDNVWLRSFVKNYEFWISEAETKKEIKQLSYIFKLLNQWIRHVRVNWVNGPLGKNIKKGKFWIRKWLKKFLYNFLYISDSEVCFPSLSGSESSRLIVNKNYEDGWNALWKRFNYFYWTCTSE